MSVQNPFAHRQISPYFIPLFFTLLPSFGFTEKGSGRMSHQAIGVYGNGFKSGSMRLGCDALIFTKNGGCQTVGMLSQTYLKNIKAQAVIIPIVPFNQQTNILCKLARNVLLYRREEEVGPKQQIIWMSIVLDWNANNSSSSKPVTGGLYSEYVQKTGYLHASQRSDLNSASQSLVVTEDSEASLAAILKHSIIDSQEQILSHFDSITSKKGTKILIWNIRRSNTYLCLCSI